MKLLHLLKVVSLIGLLSGCAFGNKHNYRGVVATVSPIPEQNLAVATQDKRPYILDGDKEPSFVGLQRGGYGNPFDVNTDSDEPLSDSFSAAVCSSLAAAGAECGVVATQPSETLETVISKLKHEGRDRTMMFTLREWKSDCMQNTALHYDVELEVRGPDGEVVARRTIKGNDDLRGSFWNPAGYSKRAVPEAFRKKLEEFLNAPAIQSALGVGERAATESRGVLAKSTLPAAKESECSVKQILAMKNAGLTDLQIKRTCIKD